MLSHRGLPVVWLSVFVSIAALLGPPEPAGAAVITGITTSDIAGPSVGPRTVTDSGGGTVNVTYDGDRRQVNTFTTSAGAYSPLATGAVTVRRNNGSGSLPGTNPNVNNQWNYAATGSNTNVQGQYLNSLNQVIASNNILQGAENLFANASGSGDIVQNVERVDFVFNGGLTVNNNLAFMVMDRGQGNSVFGIAAITAIDGSGNATAFGVVKEYTSNNWGPTAGLLPALNTSGQYDAFRSATVGGTDLNYRQGDLGPQAIGGVAVLATTDLGRTSGTTIYGYSLFALDVVLNANGTLPTDWLSASRYPENTSLANGDIDLVSTGAIAWTRIPEPGTYALLGVAALSGLFYWRRRNSARPRSLPRAQTL